MFAAVASCVALYLVYGLVEGCQSVEILEHLLESYGVKGSEVPLVVHGHGFLLQALVYHVEHACVDALVQDVAVAVEGYLYDVEWGKQYGYKILRVLVDKKGGIQVQELALVNDYLSEKLDNVDVCDGEYMLEVCSPGAEKPLRNNEELVNAIGEYIHVKTKEAEYEGYLLEVSDEEIKIKVNVKGRIKEVIVERALIKKIRLAVKL